MLEKGIREADRRDTGNMKGSFAVNSKCGKKPLILAGAEMDFETAPVIVEAVTRFAAKGIYGFTLAESRAVRDVLTQRRFAFFCDLHQTQAAYRTLAYATFPPYQRLGYMGEALLSMIRRHEADAPYLHGGHFPFNAPSERLLLSLGFREYGQHASGKATIIDKTRFFDG